MGRLNSERLPFPPLPFPPLPFPLLPSHPFPFPPFPLPSFPLPLEVGPLFAARESGGALKLPSGSGRSPAAKRFLVLIELKILYLMSCYLDQVDHEMVHFGAL